MKWKNEIWPKSVELWPLCTTLLRNSSTKAVFLLIVRHYYLKSIVFVRSWTMSTMLSFYLIYDLFYMRYSLSTVVAWRRLYSTPTNQQTNAENDGKRVNETSLPRRLNRAFTRVFFPFHMHARLARTHAPQLHLPPHSHTRCLPCEIVHLFLLLCILTTFGMKTMGFQTAHITLLFIQRMCHSL